MQHILYTIHSKWDWNEIIYFEIIYILYLELDVFIFVLKDCYSGFFQGSAGCYSGFFQGSAGNS